jgi:hypothetical protein
MDGKKKPSNNFFKLNALRRKKMGDSMNQMDGK